MRDDHKLEINGSMNWPHLLGMGIGSPGEQQLCMETKGHDAVV
jgi:hypothetical protein